MEEYKIQVQETKPPQVVNFAKEVCNFFLENKCKEEASIIEDALKKYEDSDLTLVLMGETSSGKTTSVNSLISYDRSKKDFNQNNALLPTDKFENTFFMWTVRRSQDDKIRIKYKGDEIEYSSSKDARTKIKELNEIQKEKITKAKDAKIETELEEVEIQIPGMMPKIQVIDFPGLSCENASKNLEKKLKNMMVCFLYVKDLTAPEKVNEKILNLIRDYAKTQNQRDPNHIEGFEEMKNNNRHFFVIYSKKDKTIEVTASDEMDNPDCDKNQIEQEFLNRGMELLKENLDMLESNDNSNGILVRDIFLFDFLSLNSKKPENKEKHEKEMKIFERLINGLLSFQKVFNEDIQTINTIVVIERQLLIFSEKHKTRNNEFDDLYQDLNKEKKNFQDQIQVKIKETINNLSSFEKFQKKEKDLYEKIKKIIENANKQQAEKQKKWKKEEFIQDILNIAKVEIFKEINSEINERCEVLFKKYLSYIMKKIGEKNMIEAFQIQIDCQIVSVNLSSDNLIAALFGAIGIAAGIGWGTVGFLGSRLGFIAAEAFIPGLGWVAAGASIASGIYGIKNYIGLYDENDCAKTTLKTLSGLISTNEKELFSNYWNYQNQRLENVFQKWVNYAKMTQEINSNFKNKMNYFRGKNSSLQKQIEKNIGTSTVVPNWNKVCFDDFGFSDEIMKNIKNIKKEFGKKKE